MKKTDAHEWIKLEGNIATVGITPFAAKEIGDIVFIQFPSLGSMIKKGEEAAVLESTKAAIDTYAPLSGKIISINESAQKDPLLLTQDPLVTGWLYKIEVTDPEEYEQYSDHS